MNSIVENCKGFGSNLMYTENEEDAAFKQVLLRWQKRSRQRQRQRTRLIQIGKRNRVLIIEINISYCLNFQLKKKILSDHFSPLKVMSLQ